MRFITASAAAGAVATVILLGTGCSEAADPQNAPPVPATYETPPPDSATMQKLEDGCVLYTEVLKFFDDQHFKGQTTVSQKEIAEGAMKNLLLEAAEKPEQLTWADPETKKHIASLTLDGAAIPASPAPGAMTSYADHCAYLNQTVLKLAKTTGTEIRVLFKDALNGAIHKGFDPHSSYLDDKAYKDMQVQTKGSFGGLGIEVNMKDGLVQVVSPIDGTPASRAGLQANDLITHIKQPGQEPVPVQGMDLGQAVALMRGDIGTDVILTVMRGGEALPDITLKREEIKINPVKLKMVGPDNDIPYITVTTFNEQTTPELEATLDKLKAEFAAKGTPLKKAIISFKNNPGGLLDQAMKVGDDLIISEEEAALKRFGEIREELNRLQSEGKSRTDPAVKALLTEAAEINRKGGNGEFKNTRIVATGKNADERPTMTGEASLKNYADEIEFFYMGNEGSASASEIVLGAVRDDGAEIVGTTTFGKGSVQTIIPVDGRVKRPYPALARFGGAIRITTVAFFSGETGLSNQQSGVPPTVEVRYNDERDEASEQARHERDLEHSLVSTEQTRASQYPEFTCSLKEEFAGILSAQEAASVPEYLRIKGAQTDTMDDPGKTVATYVLDADLACTLKVMGEGGDAYVDITPYMPLPPATMGP